MAVMKQIWEDIHYLLDTTGMSCDEIAYRVGCPIEWVNDVVEQRWREAIDDGDTMGAAAMQVMR